MGAAASTTPRNALGSPYQAGTVYIEVYTASWCPHCHAIADELHKLQQQALAHVVIYDCDVDAAQCAQRQVQGYPTILLVDGASGQVLEQYTGPRTAAAMLQRAAMLQSTLRGATAAGAAAGPLGSLPQMAQKLALAAKTVPSGRASPEEDACLSTAASIQRSVEAYAASIKAAEDKIKAANDKLAMFTARAYGTPITNTLSNYWDTASIRGILSNKGGKFVRGRTSSCKTQTMKPYESYADAVKEGCVKALASHPAHKFLVASNLTFSHQEGAGTCGTSHDSHALCQKTPDQLTTERNLIAEAYREISDAQTTIRNLKPTVANFDCNICRQVNSIDCGAGAVCNVDQLNQCTQTIKTATQCSAMGGTFSNGQCIAADVTCKQAGGTYNAATKICTTPQMQCSAAGGLWQSLTNTCLMPANCTVTAYGTWSPCSAACGSGTQTRTRTVVTSAANGGAACPALQETQQCTGTTGCPPAAPLPNPTQRAEPVNPAGTAGAASAGTGAGAASAGTGAGAAGAGAASVQAYAATTQGKLVLGAAAAVLLVGVALLLTAPKPRAKPAVPVLR